MFLKQYHDQKTCYYKKKPSDKQGKTMFLHPTLAIGLLFVLASKSHARHVYVNGTDVSSARHAIIEGAHVRIDGKGNIFITAPHYQVHEESLYIPLSSWNKGPGAPDRQVGQAQETFPNLSEGEPMIEPEGEPSQPLGQPGTPGAKEGTKSPPTKENP